MSSYSAWADVGYATRDSEDNGDIDRERVMYEYAILKYRN